jgi:UDP-N-acetylglucosamine diphosphorylase/glucosamine-1-phosphate N-acetyltransferase
MPQRERNLALGVADRSPLVDHSDLTDPTSPSRSLVFLMTSTTKSDDSDSPVSDPKDPCAVILAAGKGTRMKSDLPKVLCRVVDRPMIHFVLDALTKSGVNKQIVVVGYQADLVRQELSSRSPVPQFALQREQLGTGHAVMMCRDLLKNQTGPTIVLAGDSPLVQPDSLRELFDYFNKHRPSLLLGTLKKEDPTGLGRIVRNQAGEFTGIVEHKDATEAQRQIKEVNMSTYLFNTADLLATLDSLDSNNSQNEYYLTDCASLLRKAGKKVEALPVLRECESMSINNPDELNQVDQAMRAMGYA